MANDYFNVYKYADTHALEQGTYVRATDEMANAGLVISFWHVPSGKSVYFKAFITAFNETYSSDWASESVYGRADPIYLFKQTQRKITLAFKIPCASRGEGYDNLCKVQSLIQFLYPSYEDPASATTITQSPLVRIKVMNLLATNQEGGSPGMSPDSIYNNYKSSRDASGGTLGVINSLTVNHNLENGESGVIEKGIPGGEGVDAILPKLIDVNLDFSVIHETPLGWESSTGFSNLNFPYGTPCSDDLDAISQEAVQQQAEAAVWANDLRAQATADWEAGYRPEGYEADDEDPLLDPIDPTAPAVPDQSAINAAATASRYAGMSLDAITADLVAEETAIWGPLDRGDMQEIVREAKLRYKAANL